MKRLILLLAAVPASANPMLDLCLPIAPKICGLTKDSAQDDYLKCFEDVMLKTKIPAERACASELLHARVHKACDPFDIPTVCAGVKKGGNRTMNCLTRRRKKLTKECGTAIDEYNALEHSGDRKKRKDYSSVGAVRC